MTKCVFIANGQEFKTYEEARNVSKYVETKYVEGWKDPEETLKAEKVRAEYAKYLEQFKN